MSLDRDLITTIKLTFADYSSALLNEIVQSKDQARWSLEAVAAAAKFSWSARRDKAKNRSLPSYRSRTLRLIPTPPI